MDSEIRQVSADPLGNEFALTCIQRAVARVRDEVPAVEGLLLEGGFGRGEGGVVPSGDSYQLVNDIDLLVVSHQPLRSRSQVAASVRRIFQEETGIDRCDIAHLLFKDIPRLSPTVQNYDRIHGSSVLIGRPDLLRGAPIIKASDIRPREAEKLLFTRMISFLIVHRGLMGGPVDEFFHRQQLAKATIAAADALLILKGEYHHSYTVRMERARGLDCLIGDQALVAEDFNFKLLPRLYAAGVTEERFHRVLDVFVRSLEAVGKTMYRRTWRGLAGYHYNYARELRKLGIQLVEFCRGLDRYRRDIFLNVAQLELLLAIRYPAAYKQHCDKAVSYFARASGRDMGSDLSAILPAVVEQRLLQEGQ